jgi:hypothetical protein
VYNNSKTGRRRIIRGMPNDSHGHMLSKENLCPNHRIGLIAMIGVIAVFAAKAAFPWELHFIKDMDCMNTFIIVTRRRTVNPYSYTSEWEYPRLLVSSPLFYK